MSETAQIKTKFKDLKTVKAAFESLGWKIEEKTKMHTYPYDSNRNKVYDWVARNPENQSNSYDIGISRVDGEIDLHCDFYGGSIARQIGRGFEKLKQRYALKKIQEDAEENDYEVVTKELDNGAIEVEVFA